MVAAVDKEECMSFETCVEDCSQETIAMGDDEIAVIDADKCTEFCRCIEFSPPRRRAQRAEMLYHYS